MSRAGLLLVSGGLLLGFCGCPGGEREKSDDPTPTPSAEKSNLKPPESESNGSEEQTAESGVAVALGVGAASNRDPAVAARRAAEDALGQLGARPKGIVFCIYFPEIITTTTTDENGFEVEVEHQQPDPEKERMALAALRETAGLVPTIGCRGQALAREGTRSDDTVAVLAVGGDDVACRAVKAEFGDDRRVAGETIAKGLAGVADLKLAVVLSDRDLAYNGKPNPSVDDFVAGLRGALGEGPVLFGGLAMPVEDAESGFGGVFLGDEAVDGTAVALGIGGPIGVHAAAAHEFEPAETVATVTRTDGTWVEQLDGRPAAAVYREIRGMEPDDEFTRDWQHPIDVAAGPEAFCLRMVLDEDKPRGALRFLTSIGEGTAIQVLYGGGDAGAILDSAGWAVRESLEKSGDAKPLALLLSDDAARGRRLEEFRDSDVDVVQQAVLPAIESHRDLPIFGLSTFGQFGPGKMLHQQAAVAAVICGEKQGEE